MSQRNGELDFHIIENSSSSPKNNRKSDDNDHEKKNEIDKENHNEKHIEKDHEKHDEKHNEKHNEKPITKNFSGLTLGSSGSELNRNYPKIKNRTRSKELRNGILKGTFFTSQNDRTMEASLYVLIIPSMIIILPFNVNYKCYLKYIFQKLFILKDIFHHHCYYY